MTKERSYECKVKECFFNTSSPLLYVRHCSVFHKSGIKNNFFCGKTFCHRTFKCYSSFVTHLSRDHTLPSVKKKSVASVISDYPCTICSSSFVSLHVLVSHLKRHLKCRHTTVMCPYNGCSKTFSVISSFSAHISRNHGSQKNLNPSLSFSDNKNEDHKKNCENVGQISESETCADYVKDLERSCKEINFEMDSESSESSLEKSLALFCLVLVSKLHIPEQTVQLILDKFSSVMDFSVGVLKSNLEHELTNINNVDLHSLKEIINHVFKDNYSKNPLLSTSSLRSSYSRRKYYRSNFNFVSPVEIRLGLNKLNKECHMHYVPILLTLKALLSNEIVYSQYQTSSCRIPNISNNDFVLTEMKDGSVMKEHLLFSVNSQALQVIIFQDEFLIANPLGPSRKELKMLGVYCTLGNLQPWCRSKVDSIQLVLLCRSIDLRYFGQNVIFGKLLQDLKVLENDGIEFGDRKIKGSVSYIAGDNLGSHFIGGYVENFNSHYFCRYCTISKDEFERGVRCGEIRTQEKYDAALKIIDANSLENFEGIKMKSVFNTLQYFHVANGLPPCIAHDVFEGIAQYDLPLILRSMENEGWISLEALNRKIQKFQYKNHDNNNKPGQIALTGNRLGGQAVQTLTLIRLLPLIVGKQIGDYSHPAWRLFLLLLQICQIICSPRINLQIVGLLAEGVLEYIDTRKNLYPEERLKPKHHYIIHYPRLILMYGPLASVSTLRFESKHKYFKKCQVMSGNTKNVTKTLSFKHQMLQAAYSVDNIFACESIINNGSSYKPTLFSDPFNLCIKDAGLGNADIIVGFSCSHRGLLYKSDDVVVLRSQLVLNLVIMEAFAQRSKEIFIIGTVAKGHHLEELGVHRVEKKQQKMCVSIELLQDYEPYAIYEDLGYPVIVLKHLTS